MSYTGTGMSGFTGDDTELVVGDGVHGIRVWDTHDDGLLRGVTFPQIWMATGNVASCYSWVSCVRSKAHPEELLAESTTPCDGIGLECGCGFWAYWNRDARGASVNGNRSGVLGVIRGYGVTTEGSKGFRAQKADVVALCFPQGRPNQPLGWDAMATPHVHTAETVAAVRAAYPGVPVYWSLAALAADYPCALAVKPKNDPTRAVTWAQPPGNYAAQLHAMLSSMRQPMPPPPAPPVTGGAS